MTTITCPTCSTTWECHCQAEPCLFEGKNCDGCELDRLDAEAEAALT